MKNVKNDNQENQFVNLDDLGRMEFVLQRMWTLLLLKRLDCATPSLDHLKQCI